jgi:hypothetical protein
MGDGCAAGNAGRIPTGGRLPCVRCAPDAPKRRAMGAGIEGGRALTMFLQLTHEERDLVLELISEHLQSLRQEIRRCEVSRFHDELVQKKHLAERLVHRLHESQFDCMN